MLFISHLRFFPQDIPYSYLSVSLYQHLFPSTNAVHDLPPPGAEGSLAKLQDYCGTGPDDNQIPTDRRDLHAGS